MKYNVNWSSYTEVFGEDSIERDRVEIWDEKGNTVCFCETEDEARRIAKALEFVDKWKNNEFDSIGDAAYWLNH